MSRHTQIGIRCTGLTLATVFGFFMAMACGGGGATSTPTDETPAAVTPTIAVSGTVSGITASATINATKSLHKKAKTAQKVADITGANLTVTCATLDGISLGTATSGDDGTFIIDADSDILKPADATETSYTVDIICSAKSDDGKVDFKTIYTFTVEEGTTTDVSIGTIDMDSTLAAASLGGDLGCDLEVGSKCTKITGMDLRCARAGLNATWSQASTANTSDVASLSGVLKTSITALYTAGINWADMGCKSASTCIKQFTDCTLSDADLAIALKVLSIAIPNSVDPDFAVNKVHWIDACTATKTVHDITTTSLAGSAEAATACAQIIEGGNDFARVFTQPFMAVGTSDVATMSDLFLPKVFNFVGDVIKNSAGANLDGSGHTFLGYIENQKNTYNNFTHLPTQTSEFSFFGNVVKQSVGMSRDQQKNYATGWFNTIEANGFHTFCAPGSACGDSTTGGMIGLIGSTFVQPGFNPNTHNYAEDGTMFSQIPNLPNDEKAPIFACQSVVNMTAKLDCFKTLKNDGSDEVCHSTLLRVGEYCNSMVSSEVCEHSYMRYFSTGQGWTAEATNGATFSYHNCSWIAGTGCTSDGNSMNEDTCTVNGSSGGIFAGGGGGNNGDSIDYSVIFGGPCNGTTLRSYAQAQSALVTCNDGNDLLALYQAIYQANEGQSGCMPIGSIVNRAAAAGVTICGGGGGGGGGGGQQPPPPMPDSYFDGNWTTNGCFAGAVTITAGTGSGLSFSGHSNGSCTATAPASVQCTYTDGMDGPSTIYISGTCILTKQQQQQQVSLEGYWDGTWYSNNTSCIPNLSVASNVAQSLSGLMTVGHFTTQTNQGISGGSCSFFRDYTNGNPSVQATGCGHSGAGIGNSPLSDIVVSLTGFIGQNGSCAASLTKTPHTYFDGTWNATTNCYATSSYTLVNGQSGNLTIGSHNFGFCSAYMSGVQLGCSYANGISITLTTPGSLCSTTLTPAQGGGGGGDPAPSVNFWGGQTGQTWYAYDLGSYPRCELSNSSISVNSNGMDFMNHLTFTNPVDNQGSGTCQITKENPPSMDFPTGIYNSSNPGTCTYSMAGTDTTAAFGTIIEIHGTGWRNNGDITECGVKFTRTPPPANPTDEYWNGSWVHTQDETYTCLTQTIAIANRQWFVTAEAFLTFSKPNSFISAGNGSLTLPSTDTVPFSYGRGANSAVNTVESGTIIHIPNLNTPQGICSMRLVKQ